MASGIRQIVSITRLSFGNFRCTQIIVGTTKTNIVAITITAKEIDKEIEIANEKDIKPIITFKKTIKNSDKINRQKKLKMKKIDKY